CHGGLKCHCLVQLRVGYLTHCTQPIIFHRGGSAATNGPDIQARLDELQAEVEYLDNLEKKVDEHRSKVLQSLKNVQEDLDNLQYAYVTHQDLINIFQDRTMLVIRAPPGTRLEAPVPENPMEQPVQSLFALKRSYKVRFTCFYILFCPTCSKKERQLCKIYISVIP
ncbi:hypothetical protein AHF37_12213, partial [Paragonimus kellicotti]